jgi:creatinine amidohydrolase/Fe(II)-dependent formamide hydrolase-like protein
MVTKLLTFALASLLSTTAFAGQGARPPQTPEQADELKRRAAATAIAEGVRPIDMLDSVWIEELSWMEVRDHLIAGKTTVLLGTGGVEKNGPYTATGKHNYTLKTTLEAIARKHTKALVAPLITWEPCNPERQNLTPGTFCVTQETYKALLRDALTSLKSMGFKDIFMVADSGGNPPSMIEVAKELNAKWMGNPAKVYYVPEYYDEDRWSYNFMKQTLGITQVPDVQSATRWDIHDDYHYEALVAVQDPKLVHAEQRIKGNKFSIYGVEIGSIAKLVENGRKLADYRATITINAMKKAQEGFSIR